MNDAKFTPGPWSAIDFAGNDLVVTAINDSGRESIALLGSHSTKRFTNANLIAAAPDMYEALEMAILEYGKPGGPWNVPSESGTWINKAKAAIVKARGEA